MSKADILIALRPNYSVAVPVLGGVSVRPTPAVELAILMSESEDLYDAIEDPRTALESDEFLAAVLDSEQLRPVFERLVSASLPHVDEAVREKAVSSTGVTFAHLAFAAFQIALPRDVGSLFKARKKSSGWEVDADVDDIAVDIMKTASRLHGAGYLDAFAMSWTRLVFTQRIETEREIDRLMHAALAARVGPSDDKGWKKFTRSLGR